MEHAGTIASELSLDASRIRAVLKLMDEGATIPFLARYRKELSGGMDEVELSMVRDARSRLAAMEARRSTILSSLEERGLLTEELRLSIGRASKMSELEDIYLPYRPKRRTRASIATERGLAPLADMLLKQGPGDPERMAGAFIDVEKGVPDAEAALQGARDIIAEKVTEAPEVNRRARKLYMAQGMLRSRVIKGKENEGQRFRDWFDHSEKADSAASHRILAMRRGEKELILNLRIEVERERVLSLVSSVVGVKKNPCGEQVLAAVEDGIGRLLGPRMETSVRMGARERAEAEAVRVFALNLKELLMAPPLGEKAVMALDPGFRTGCKTVCLDRYGKLLEHTVIYPHTGQEARAGKTVKELAAKHAVECIAVGNGTAGRETRFFLEKLAPGVPVVMVNESGASVYSASEAAREEFPELDLTVRGAISIGRRLQDPLSELVKIDPKSIGVGQYQHDVDQKLLGTALDDTVASCVNSVGVNLNTAGAKLLSYVSGLTPARARAILAKRREKGGFRNRNELLEVQGIGPVAFQQSAGFLRITGGDDELDSSAVHPESYHVVHKMAKRSGTTVKGLLSNDTLIDAIDPADYTTPELGLPTIRDILAELRKPGRDPRKGFEPFSFGAVHTLEDLKEGMKLPGIVTNVTGFGAFVDIGVHTDGLVHISAMSERWVSHPCEVVKAGMRVDVTVTEIDLQRKRISLSMI